MKFRTDIQALRGWAVLLVVLYHADLGFFVGGYLGVDIFFVISGFLITGIIKKSIEQDTFSFSAFYFRRAKRLLPASYVTFFFTALLAPIFLNIGELQDFTLQLFGAITYSANIFLWLQTGYFEGAAELKPLLHIWSLSIEEQYYLLLPAALVFTPRRYWASGAWLITISSLVLALILVSWKTNSTFYLLPTRAWELALGSVGTLALSDGKFKNFLSYFTGPAIAALILVPIFPLGGYHPGLNAILVCFATLVVLIVRPTILDAGIIARVVARVGDFSYSLYLIHWPIFAFAQNIYLSNVPLNIRLMIIPLSLVLGYLLFRYIELPIRRTNIEYSPKLLIATLTVSATIVLTPMALTTNQASQKKFAEIIRPNFGFGEECEFTQDFSPKKECRNSESPQIMVWGDSYAMHLVPGIVASTKLGIVQATRSVCGPFIEVAPISFGKYNRTWAERCLKFNQSVFKYLASKKSIKIVVLSSLFRQYLNDPTVEKNRLLQKTNNKWRVLDGGVKIAVEALAKTVKKLRSIGKKVVIVAPPPRGDFDIGKCLERKYSNKLIMGDNSDCSFPIEEYQSEQKLVLAFLKETALQANVNVVKFDDLLCSKTNCQTVLDETIIYRDKGHLSYSGSKLLGRKMDLASVLIKAAY